MIIKELNENPNPSNKKSEDILVKKTKSLKKKNIPERLRLLLNIMDSCELILEDGNLTTAGLILSSFSNEMKSINKALITVSYSPKDDKEMLIYACYIYRTKKFNHEK